ncbi:hypothetical protein [Rhodococcus qingshengii]|nr:hypothetical protein [Rhodococcus qingshengii]
MHIRKLHVDEVDIDVKVVRSDLVHALVGEERAVQLQRARRIEI